MEMTVEEIKRHYMAAKDKEEQIEILSDLNCTTKEHIIEILGLNADKTTYSDDGFLQSMFVKLDEIEEKIKKHGEKECYVKQYNEIARAIINH